MKVRDIALILVVVVLVAFTPNSPISVLARDVLADARPAPLSAAPVGTSFTYQGQLMEDGEPADGVYDFQFTLYDEETAGSPVGSPVEVEDVVVTGGVFSTELDFGASAFTGEARWLEIGVRPGDSTGSYTTLDPRQKVTPTPYALYAANADILDGQHGTAFASSAHNHWGQTWTGSGTGLTLTSSNSIGLSAGSTAGSGLTYGVYGTSNSTSGNGVVGWATAGSGSTVGVVGRSDSPAGKGVNGYTTAATGGTGVFGEANATSGGAAGVEGISHATDGGAGVYGIGAGGTGNTYGVYGWSQSTGGTGALGYTTAASGATIGVRGRSDSTSGWGGLFDSLGNGVLAKAPASGNIFEGRQYPSDTVKFSVSGAGDVTAAGLYKYITPKTSYVSIPALEFVPIYPAEVIASGDVWSRYIKDAGSWSNPSLYAGVHIPNGAILTGFQCDVYDNDPANDLNVTLYSRHLGGWGVVPHCTAGTLGVPGVQIIGCTCSSLVDNAERVYQLDFAPNTAPCNFNGQGCRIYGCAVSYSESQVP